MGALITLFRGWAVPFIVLLDSDGAGNRERARYIQNYDLSDHQVMQLHDVVSALKGQSFEGIFKDDVKKAIEAAALGRGEKLKEDASQYFQLLLATKDMTPKFGNTMKVFAKLHAALRERLGLQD